MKLAVLSDIHGNLEAIKAVLNDIESGDIIDAFVILGDIIDYGPHSNEVIELLKAINKPVLCNIWGNHEKAILNGDLSRFSSKRGRESAMYTKGVLSDESIKYISDEMSHEGRIEIKIDGYVVFAVHGSIEDPFWGSIKPDIDVGDYAKYDMVFSGHSHEPHFFEKYSKIECETTRNKKKTIFINPGSVGQPRNINNMAQYAFVNTLTEEVRLIKIPYDVSSEIDAFSNEVDEFYKNRLVRGI